MPEAKEHSDDLVWDEVPRVAEPLYGIEDRPEHWWEALLYGWQHTLVDISPFILPLAVAAALGFSASEQASFINYGLVAMGLATLVQTTLGNRLPIIQGPSATLTATLGPVAAQVGAPAMWGGIFLGGLIEMTIGLSGVLRNLRRLFPPVVSGVVIMSIGLSLGHLAIRLSVGDGRPLNFIFSGTAIGLVLLLQFRCRRLWGGLLARGAIFVSIWVVGLGLGGVLGEVDWTLLQDKPWLALPALFPYGGPGFGWQLGLVTSLVIFAGYLGSMVESLGDYAATCAVAGEPYRVRHMNRGIFAEGLGACLGAVFGGLPCTSYTQNIGIIATTRVASRFVVQIAAGILILYGLSPKFGGLLVAMPRSVLGGVFVLITGMIVVSGARLLQRSLQSNADAIVVGLTLIVSLALPIYAQNGLPADWLEARPMALRLLMTNSVVLAVATAVGLNVLLQDRSSEPTGLEP
jgi:uracil-xanthine permease